MAIEIRQIEDTVWYLPDIDDNRETGKDDPFRVLIEPMSAQQYRREEEKFGKVNRGKLNFVRRSNKLRAHILERCIKVIKGCYAIEVVDGKEARVLIDTGALLTRYAREEILEDIYEAIKNQSQLVEGIEGNLRSQSGSSSREIRTLGDGAATTAKPIPRSLPNAG